MPRSSRHKSHKQSKHSLREEREYSDSDIEDVKVKDSGSGSILDRVLKDSGIGMGRGSSQVKEVMDLSGHRNGDVVEEYVSSKMHKEEKARDKSNGGDGREGPEKEKKGETLKYDGEKGSILREVKVDVKSRSSKRYESGRDMKEENGALLEDKEYYRSGSRSEKRKSEKEKDGNDIKELREKERGFEKEKKVAESRRSNEVNLDGDIVRKHQMQSDVLVEDRHGKRRRNSVELNAEIDEKRVRKKKETCGDLDKYQDDIRDGEARRLSSRSERLKEGRSFDEKKEGDYGEKNCAAVDKNVTYNDDLDRDSKHRDAKYRDDGDRDSRHRDDKYRERGDRDGRRREDKYLGNSGRDAKHIDDKNRGEVERHSRLQDDKYREDGGRDNRRKDVKHMEEVDKESRRCDNRYYNEADRDGRHKVERSREDTDRDIRHKEDKYHDEYERENKHRDTLGVDDDREKMFREGKYRDDRLLKDRSGDKSDSKRSRDENHVSGFHSRKSSLYDDGDDRMSRYKDDHVEKHSGHRREDLANERGRSTSKIADLDLSATHYRRQSSSSSGSHIVSNQYRLPKQDEPKYKDYSVTPNREHEKKHLQKDDTNSGEFSAERRLKPDTRASPMSLIDKSPSSISERKNSRTDVRRNLDGDASGPRYGGLKDGKNFFGREGRRSRDVAMDKIAGDEFSEVDGDNGSVFSPSARSGPLSNSAKSLLAPAPFRTGADNSLPFGTSDDDSRGKSSNRHRRPGDASMGRMQGNSWRGAPNWPSPVPNGFMPVGFHHVMQQFPVPHLFGVRPPMDLNHGGLPYPIPDPDRFSGHVRPMGWRNLDDDPCPPPLHGWEANNAAFNDDSHLFGRPDWDSARNHSGSASTEMDVSEKQNIFVHGVADEYIAGQFSQQSQHVKTQHGFQADTREAVQRETSEPSLGSKENLIAEDEPEKDDGNMCRAYLSMLDISADLAGPELYAQCANLHGLDHNLLFDGDQPKILYLEGDVDGKAPSDKISSTFLFSATNDSVFQKAMILYNKLKAEFKIGPDPLSPGLRTTGSFPNQSGESMSRKDVAVEELEMAGGEQEQIDLPNISQVEEPGILNVEAACFSASQNRDADDLVDKSDSCVYATSNTSMEVQVSSDIGARDINDSVMEENLGLETADSPANAVKSEMTMSSDVTMASDVPISSFNGERGVDVKCGGSVISDVPEACEAVMPEPIDSGLVNLSRIHHSPESTH